MSDERDDLDNLLKADGWRRLCDWAQREWRDQVASGVETAANTPDDVAALNRLRQVIAAKKSVELVLSWPERRLKELATATAKADQPVRQARGGF